VESMEGASAALAARLYETPFAEIRAISNIAGDRDKKNWDFQSSLAHLHDTMTAIIANHF